AAADCVFANAGAEFAPPTEPLLLDGRRFGLRTHESRITGTVSFAQRVSARDQCNSLFIIHCHACEGLSDVTRGSDWIWITVRPFWIYINQSHLNCTQRIIQLTVATIALVSKPLSFRTPIDLLFGLPHVFTSAAEAEGFESHRLQCDVDCKDHEVGPGDFLAIL